MAILKTPFLAAFALSHQLAPERASGISDSFSGSASLGGREPDVESNGGTWSEVAGTWAVGSGFASNSDATTGQKIASIDFGFEYAFASVSVTTPSSGEFASRLIFRRASDGTYLAVELNSSANWIAIRHWDGGSFNLVKSATYNPSNGTTYSIEIRCQGDSLFVLLDGVLVLAANSSINNGETSFGIGEYVAPTYGTTAFDDFAVVDPRDGYTAAIDFVAVGDSITAGQGASSAANRYVNRIATAKGWTFYNAGVGACSLQNTVQNSVSTIGDAQDDNIRDRFANDVLGKFPEYIVIMAGINDLRLDDPAYSETLFENDLLEIVQMAIDFGIDPTKIFIGSPSYVKSYSAAAPPYDAGNQTKHDAYSAACESVATALGCHYIDTERAMSLAGGNSLIADETLHPNDDGHDVLASSFLEAMAA